MSQDFAETSASALRALTIAGFDPGSGAGIAADLLTFARFGIFACSAITALTVQSTRGVRHVQPVDPALLRDTLQELEADLPADGIKIGMLAGAPQVRVVVDWLSRAVRHGLLASVSYRTRRTELAVLSPARCWPVVFWAKTGRARLQRPSSLSRRPSGPPRHAARDTGP